MSGVTPAERLAESIRRVLDNVAHGPLCGLDRCPGCEAIDALAELSRVSREAEQRATELAAYKDALMFERSLSERAHGIIRTVNQRLWWFIEQDGGDGGEIETAEVASRAIALQDEITTALAASRDGRTASPATPEGQT